MKRILALTTALLLSATFAYSGGTHTGSHNSEPENADDSHAHVEGSGPGGHHDEMVVGKPGEASAVSRTINVKMIETDDGEMLFEPASVSVKQGETIRFAIINAGETDHEFVLDEHEKNMEHKKLMAKFPEMEHDDPNSVRLEQGQEGEIIWSFTNNGVFEFACLIPGHYELGMKGSLIVASK